MLRVLFIILAVVSIVLAIVLDQVLLYAVSAGFLVATGVLIAVRMKKRHRDVPEMYTQVPMSPEEDLGALGIMDIKPKSKSSASASASVSARPDTDSPPSKEKEPGSAFSSDSGADSSPAEDSETVESSSNDDAKESAEDTPRSRPEQSAINGAGHPVHSVLSTPRTRTPRARIMVSEASSQTFEDVLIPCLNSLRASVGAYTVCLLRQEDIPLRYHMEVMISQNSYARANGSFSASEPLLAGHRALVPVVYPRIGPNGFPKKKLSYYHEPINIRQVAMVPVSPKKADHLYLLVVDTMNDGGLEAASVRVLMEQYARLLTALLDTSFEGELASPPTTDNRSRREIIAEEIERARTLSHPLSLAIVYLNRGEDLGGDAEEQMVVLESEFEARLRDIAVDARIERFGELTYGIFYHGAREGVARWAGGLRNAFEAEPSGEMDGGLSVGVAILQDRHESPDDLRNDATAALRESFETGECTVVE